MSNVIKEMQTISLKQMDCINTNADNLNQLAGFVKTLQDNQNLLATKVMKLEKRIDELETKEYERDLNERPSN